MRVIGLADRSPTGTFATNNQFLLPSATCLTSCSARLDAAATLAAAAEHDNRNQDHVGSERTGAGERYHLLEFTQK
ncbi:hypothetical protein VN12_22695 [Pirellula sp. SH-Sr6A]|nr:hypothetical protein VN12_22695 [Pirellula sp. SH-Sr6A]